MHIVQPVTSMVASEMLLCINSTVGTCINKFRGGGVDPGLPPVSLVYMYVNTRVMPLIDPRNSPIHEEIMEMGSFIWCSLFLIVGIATKCTSEDGCSCIPIGKCRQCSRLDLVGYCALHYSL